LPRIDSTASVNPRAEIADDVVIGPYCVIDEHIRIGAGTVVDAHCVITGNTDIGERNHFFPFSSIGTPPQDHTYRGEPTRLLIGNDNSFREFVTVNTGTVKGGGITIIGNHNLLMACSHVAHDCVLADRIVMDNCALLAGHVKVEDGAILSGHAAVHQFVTVGTISMIGGLTGVTRDMPPYMIMMGDSHAPRAVNVIGMKRNGYSDEEIDSVQKAFRLICRAGKSKDEAEKELDGEGMLTAPAKNLLAFLRRSETGRLGRYLEVTRMERGGAA
jgi:UDP-N-acetylglucosamine acyltransferase